MSATKEWLLEQERKNQPDEYEYYIGNVLDKEVNEFHASVKAEVKGDIPTAFAELKKIVETQINSDIDKVVNPPVVKKPRQVNKFKGMLDGFDPFGNPLQK